jgi:hypothetical protein
VLLRGLLALFGTLVLSVAFALAIGHPDRVVVTWMLSFAFAWVVWVWLPERNPSSTRWWLTKVAGFAAFLIAVYLLAYAVSPG